MKRSHLCLLICVLLSASTVLAQDEDRDLIQFSGVVVNSQDLSPVPFTHIIIKSSRRGTISDYYGYFSFVAQELDTIMFSCVGYKKVAFVIPDTLSTDRYSLIQVLRRDTILLKEATIYPWPSKEQFQDAFLTLNIPDDSYERARKNLARAAMKEQFENMPMDGSMNFKYQMQQHQSKLYYAGQYPPITLLNPFAWAKFIEAWQRGDFKRKKKD